MFCYIKYNAVLVGSLLNPLNRDQSIESVAQKKKTRTRYEEPNHVQIQDDIRHSRQSKQGEETRDAAFDDTPNSLTNKLVSSMSLYLLKKTRFSVSITNADTYEPQSTFPTLQTEMMSTDIPEANSITALSLASTITRSEKKCKRRESVYVKARRTSIKLARSPRDRDRDIKSKEGALNWEVQRKNDMIMVNPDCYSRIFLDYVHDTLGIAKNATVDLCDEFGTMMKLYELKPFEYATCRLNNKMTYNLISVEWHTENHDYFWVTPLIIGLTAKEANLVDKLRRFAKPSISITASGLRSSRLTHRVKLPKKREISSAHI